MQFHNHDRQLVSLYSIQNVMRLQRAQNRGSFKLGSKNAAQMQHKCSTNAAQMQQKCHAARESA
jgi:hypothetical protein